jgi:hypothetical protein
MENNMINNKSDDIIMKIHRNKLRHISLEDVLIIAESAFKDGWKLSMENYHQKGGSHGDHSIEDYKDEFNNSPITELKTFIKSNEIDDAAIEENERAYFKSLIKNDDYHHLDKDLIREEANSVLEKLNSAKEINGFSCLKYQYIEDNQAYFCGEEHWQFGGHASHGYEFPIELLFDTEAVDLYIFEKQESEKKDAQEKSRLHEEREHSKYLELKNKYESSGDK